ncbi:hypothetical protein ASD15_28530 [Massilia sp. Root351]|jgi:uncharacterized membrane-anchored protein|uniref:DUF3422 family protein n=1 Tax=Massilia sp. Root351 TaxID=1736522 RepID=UPI000709E3CF|nr:DUF3422 domain-containing protein [Massilia sp. Root351]KQV87190.1 hypothetical protein ASD15_28530 [Massilia sp. Root351]
MSIVYSSLNHSLRVPLAAEIHSRPFLKLEAPELISHFAVYRNADNGAGAPLGHSQHATLGALCKHFGVSAPAGDAKYFYHDFGRFRLKWECHTEFSTYTFAGRPAGEAATEQAFEQMPVTHLPQEWLLTLQGRLMVAAHVVLERGPAPAEILQRVFEGTTLAGSQVMQGGELFTDFAIQSDGFSRFIIRDVGMRAQQAGRLVQRVLEIETYRMMALLGLPQAQQAAPALNAIEAELVKLAGAMVQTDAAQADGGSVDGATEQALLGEITRLAARIEKLSLETSYRFSASKAYFRLVNARIEELREVRIEGIPNVGEFMDRRLAPAMNTCEALAARQEALARRVANTNDLLRTRVGIIQEQQNRKILQSMNARAAQQLRLQQAVEGLSVAAISYYVVGLVGYSTKAAKVLGLVGNPEVVIGLMVPVVVAGVWLALRSMHKRLHTA